MTIMTSFVTLMSLDVRVCVCVPLCMCVSQSPLSLIKEREINLAQNPQELLPSYGT